MFSEEAKTSVQGTQPESTMVTVDIGSDTASVPVVTGPEVKYSTEAGTVSTRISRDRPFSASQRTTASTTSKTTRSSRIYHTQHSSKNFFSYRPGVLDAAFEDCKKQCIKADDDGECKATFLLTEIDHWDCEKEKVVLVCEKSMLIVKYDFVASRIYDAKRIWLHEIHKIQMGDIVYPPKSLMSPRQMGAVRLSWEAPTGWVTRWNPFSHYVPFWTLAHHPLIYYEKEMETVTYNVDEFYETLIPLVKAAYRAQKLGSEVQLVEESILIESYASVASLIFNQSGLGFSKERGGISF